MGQLCLLIALVASGYAAFAHLALGSRPPARLRHLGTSCGVVALFALSGATGILAHALVVKDFSLDYVAQYSSRLLPWHYSLSALWVGQAGSLLLWAWLLAGLAVLFRFLPTADATIRDTAFGFLMATLAFLVATMVFAADPLQTNLLARKEGQGLSPLLQHPAMLIHPPVVFCAYAVWTIPFALAAAALLRGTPLTLPSPPDAGGEGRVRGGLDATWTDMARRWALLAWTLLLAGLLLGAHWAYEELGWGGYWGWDPVENGSLLPWLTGSALIHCLMAWRHRNCLKKLAVGLAVLTFGLCHFATFLTRSGIFSSVHAFSSSPIGWMFLGLMAVLLTGGLGLIIWRRNQLTPERVARSLLARETLILVSTFLLLLLALVVMTGTLVGPLSSVFLGRTVVVEPPFYNHVLIPLGLLLLVATSAVPLLRWGEGPGPVQARVLKYCLLIGLAAAAVAYGLGVRHYLALAVTGLATVAVAALVAGVFLDAHRCSRPPRCGRPLRGRLQCGSLTYGLLRTMQGQRRRYAGYVVHLGFVLLAIGITGTGLGTQRTNVVLREGETLTWAGRNIRYVKLDQRRQPDRLIADAVLEVAEEGAAPVTLRPARHLHLLQNEWKTMVDIHSTWRGDFYTVLNAGLGDGRVALTLVDNPMMRWIWLGGLTAAAGALVAMFPQSGRASTSPRPLAIRSTAAGRTAGVKRLVGHQPAEAGRSPIT
jgi:cytochrome c-type biogenesis protein CcmF